MKKIDIRQMTIEDVKAVHEIEILCFPDDPWSLQAFEDEMSGINPSFYLVSLEAGIITGYAGLWKILDEGHIMNVAVHPEYRRHGTAELLMESLLQYFLKRGTASFTLEVRASNVPAIRLYQKFGFETVGVRKNYYGTEDGLIMWARFEAQAEKNPTMV